MYKLADLDWYVGYKGERSGPLWQQGDKFIVKNATTDEVEEVQVYLDGSWYAFEGRVGSALLFCQTADVTVADTVTETTLIGAGTGSVTIPANKLEQGDTLRIIASGYLSDTGNPTMDIKVSIGGSEICSTGANNLNSNSTDADWSMSVTSAVRQSGSSGLVSSSGMFQHDDGTSFGMVKKTVTNVDTTGTLDIDITATWGTADASNTITCQEVTVELLRVQALS